MSTPTNRRTSHGHTPSPSREKANKKRGCHAHDRQNPLHPPPPNPQARAMTWYVVPTAGPCGRLETAERGGGEARRAALPPPSSHVGGGWRCRSPPPPPPTRPDDDRTGWEDHCSAGGERRHTVSLCRPACSRSRTARQPSGPRRRRWPRRRQQGADIHASTGGGLRGGGCGGSCGCDPLQSCRHWEWRMPPPVRQQRLLDKPTAGQRASRSRMRQPPCARPPWWPPAARGAEILYST